MYVKRPGTTSAIDSVVCTGGEFKLVGDSLPGELHGLLQLTYLNIDSGAVLGVHEVPVDQLSPETQSALRTFMEAVEQDIGSQLFDQGYVASTDSAEGPVNTGMAESNEGLGGR